MKVVLIGQKWLGCETLNWLLSSDYSVIEVFAPEGDRLARAALESGVPLSFSGQPGETISSDRIPSCDLIVCAHNFSKLSECALSKPVHGAVGYHPSLLPLYRGINSVESAIANNESVTGGSVYLLDKGFDTGPVLFQDWCFIRKGETPGDLWRRALAPMGVELLEKAVGHLSIYGCWPDPIEQDVFF